MEPHAGEGTRTKLVVNHWLLALVENLAETVAFAQSLGVDPARFLQIIDGAAIGAPYAQLKGKAMLARAFPPSFPLRLAAKDLGLVLAAARDAGHRAPLAEAAQSQFQRALDLGHGDEDMAAVYWAAMT